MKQQLKILIVICIIAILSLTVYAEDLFISREPKPSEKLDPIVKDTLIKKDFYVWNTTQFWKENNCYYFDLTIGNETNITWEDKQRELICTDKYLNNEEIEKLQLLNVEWTLKQLSIDAVVTPLTVTKAEKGENLKTK